MKKNTKIILAIVLIALAMFFVTWIGFRPFSIGVTGTIYTSSSLNQDMTEYADYNINWGSDAPSLAGGFSGTETFTFSFDNEGNSEGELMKDVQIGTLFTAYATSISGTLESSKGSILETIEFSPQNMVSKCQLIRNNFGLKWEGDRCTSENCCRPQATWYDPDATETICDNGRRSYTTIGYYCDVSGTITCPEGSSCRAMLKEGTIHIKFYKSGFTAPILKLSETLETATEDNLVNLTTPDITPTTTKTTIMKELQPGEIEPEPVNDSDEITAKNYEEKAGVGSIILFSIIGIVFFGGIIFVIIWMFKKIKEI